jgi:hypothetical protein
VQACTSPHERKRDSEREPPRRGNGRGNPACPYGIVRGTFSGVKLSVVSLDWRALFRTVRANAGSLLVMQAFIDESFDDEVFVLGGYIAKEETWASFVSEWKSILPFAALNANNDRPFKVSEMAKSPDRMEKAVAFFRVIEKFKSDIIGVSVSLRCKDHNEAIRRIYRLDGPVDYCGCDNHYILAVSVLFNLIYMRERGLLASEAIGWSFDNFLLASFSLSKLSSLRHKPLGAFCLSVY